MTEQRDNFLVKGWGWAIGTFTKSSAATPVLVLYLFFSFFSLPLKAIDLWLEMSKWFIAVFLFLLVFAPNRLRSEGYNLKAKRIETLGAKGKPLLEAEEGVIYQPQALPKPKKQIAGKSQPARAEKQL